MPSQCHEGDTEDPSWIPVYTVCCIKARDPWAHHFVVEYQPASWQRKGITSALKAAHCKHNSEESPVEGVVRSLPSWHMQKECAGTLRSKEIASSSSTQIVRKKEIGSLNGSRANLKYNFLWKNTRNISWNWAIQHYCCSVPIWIMLLISSVIGMRLMSV